ncbi:MAG: PQQ-binding-like beta-propeller repeat protein, partial [Planctomycetes bacterium]|nr:PQQ-binding-like beta-propeller repeat protein [Planctomycetota bacterium]
MTSTARRRWSRELESEVDGVAFSADGGVLVHGYDPPAGMMWVDDVIPGKCASLDRNTGETIWSSPCEVGYGRGFGAGFGENQDVIVVGPSNQGHRIVRMARADGQLIGVESVPAFDEAEVHADVSFCLSAGKVFAVSSTTLAVLWTRQKDGERYHLLARAGGLLLVVYSNTRTKHYGVLTLDARNGKYLDEAVPASLPAIGNLAATGANAAILTRDLARVLPGESAGKLMIDLAMRDPEGDSLLDTCSLLAFAAETGMVEEPLWFEALSTLPLDDAPEFGIAADAGKLYLVRGA